MEKQPVTYKEFEALMKRYNNRNTQSRIHKEHVNPFKYKRVIFRNKGK